MHKDDDTSLAIPQRNLALPKLSSDVESGITECLRACVFARAERPRKALQLQEV
jgi:hypothetical protein